MTEQNTQLMQEVNDARNEIKTDTYQMSIGEIISLYQAGDINLAPAYQRLFRWKDEQKTNFIESLIIGIPVPPIFVAQKEDGKWDIVDGVQRVSTILQLTGDLNGQKLFDLTSCKYLPSIEGLTWETLPAEIQRLIKRSKLTLNIILTKNSIKAQYEVFQRLNTGGLHLSEQEIRNCLIIMSNENFYNEINRFKDDAGFKGITLLSTEQNEQEFRMELILRYLIAKYRKTNFEEYKLHSMLVSEFIDSETLALINDPHFNLTSELEILQRTSDLLFTKLGPTAFAKYWIDKQSFDNKFNLQVFEALLPGLASNIDRLGSKSTTELKEIIKGLCCQPSYVLATGRGIKALKRFKDLTDLSFQYFGTV
ncbi:DUF262 domain-containing protein [Undibacterium sp. RuTC16W]|uniref:DUF262 domain-containing protein n=1 Tax=Undibacterium sp. RuTC16W TaxID=3413048 RepID=UPI003BF05A59